jgi:hypothetical protein
MFIQPTIHTKYFYPHLIHSAKTINLSHYFPPNSITKNHYHFPINIPIIIEKKNKKSYNFNFK